MKFKLTFILFIVFFISFSIFSKQSRGVRIKKIKGNEGKRWAICIGINDYEDDGWLDLKKARNDAIELGKILKTQGQFDSVYIMTDDLSPRKKDYPKLKNIRKTLKLLSEFIKPEDLVLFSFSGHGIANQNGENHLVVSDSDIDDKFSSSLKVREIVEWLKNLSVKKSLILIDACREKLSVNKGSGSSNLRAEKFKMAEVAATFYATKSGWFSYEDPNSAYGVFTKYIIKGLKCEADKVGSGNRDGVITFSELASYVEEGVTSWAIKNRKKQKPYTKIHGERTGDLALAICFESLNQNINTNPVEVISNENDDLIWDLPDLEAPTEPAGSKLLVYSEKISGENESIAIAKGKTKLVKKFFGRKPTIEEFKRAVYSMKYQKIKELPNGKVVVSVRIEFLKKEKK